jgi:hypothetical protein
VVEGSWQLVESQSEATRRRASLSNGASYHGYIDKVKRCEGRGQDIRMRKSGRKQTTNFSSLDGEMLEKGVVSSDQNFKAVSYFSEINSFHRVGLRKGEVKIDFPTSGSNFAPKKMTGASRQIH